MKAVVLALIAVLLGACVTGHDGVDLVTSVTLNSLLWGVP